MQASHPKEKSLYFMILIEQKIDSNLLNQIQYQRRFMGARCIRLVPVSGDRGYSAIINLELYNQIRQQTFQNKMQGKNIFGIKFGEVLPIGKREFNHKGYIKEFRRMANNNNNKNIQKAMAALPPSSWLQKCLQVKSKTEQIQFKDDNDAEHEDEDDEKDDTLVVDDDSINYDKKDEETLSQVSFSSSSFSEADSCLLKTESDKKLFNGLKTIIQLIRESPKQRLSLKQIKNIVAYEYQSPSELEFRNSLWLLEQRGDLMFKDGIYRLYE